LTATGFEPLLLGFDTAEIFGLNRPETPTEVVGEQSDDLMRIGRRPIRRALISVYDKSGLLDLAMALYMQGVEIVSTGSTAKTISQEGIPVTPVERLTGFRECLDGRVKTLHPRVHAGILADLRKPSHSQQLKELGIAPFDLVVVNLYPFSETVAGGATTDECVEQIDIGGPAMVRAAAKNYVNVAIVTAPERYADILTALNQGGFTVAQRRELARDAFIHTANYDVAVATWMTSVLAPEDDQTIPAWRAATYSRRAKLRYGENPHQAAAVFDLISGGDGVHGLATAEQLSGVAMSYNNFQDADAAYRAAFDFPQPAVAIIKHANPCGLAIGTDVAQAHRKAHACDPLSAYGGVIAANRTVTLEMAQQVKPVFTEVIIAPDYEPEALELLRTKKNLRILRLLDAGAPSLEAKMIGGGLLIQERDRFQADGDHPSNWSLVAGAAATPEVLADLAFAWRAVRAVKSNAILLAVDGASVGVGMGQVNRLDAAELAVRRAGEARAKGAVAASDAFFPFADGLEVLVQAGIKAVVEPGGSVRDPEVIEAAAAAGLTLYFSGARHFFH
jgi:phosphoribosylaminoimidazolecarboxamide formyltransferase/IMP cyclohydrolase